MSRLNRILDISQHPVNLTFISSYIPRRCGIATFTKDLTKGINDLNPNPLARIVAMNHNENHKYPHEVAYVIERDNQESYEDAARFINDSTADIICLQHEYGLYGGEAGDYIFDLLERVRQPIVTTLHTILRTPDDAQKDVLFRLAKLSDAVVAMVPDAKARLLRDYGINPDKVVVIHHGVADQPKATKKNKEKFGWADQNILLITGLLNPDKGIDYAIRALPTILETHPAAKLVVVGQTHPEIVRQMGESYREGLVQLAEELGVSEHVEFINKYVTTEELLDYYEAADIYLTPHLEPQQITSGTLAIALGMGKACVSTPFVYAREMLANGTGIFVPYRDGAAIAAACLRILDDPEYQEQLENKAYSHGRRMSWPLVAERYLILFRLVQEENGISSRPK